MLGFLWSFINPLLLLAIYTFVFTDDHARTAPRRSQPYALFMFCGILPWTWFSSSLTEASGSLIAGGNLIKKVLFPAEVLPIVSVLANMVHFFLALPILVAVPDRAIAAGRTPLGSARGFRWSSLVQLVFTTGLALVLAALTVHFRDIRDCSPMC